MRDTKKSVCHDSWHAENCESHSVSRVVTSDSDAVWRVVSHAVHHAASWASGWFPLLPDSASKPDSI